MSQAAESLRFLISDDFQSGRGGAMMSFMLAILIGNILPLFLFNIGRLFEMGVGLSKHLRGDHGAILVLNLG